MESVKMITLAPEVEGSEAFIKKLSTEYPHVILSIGHSDASYEESKQSFSWGISHATHLFNAMNPYHHRKPGIVGAVFEADVTCDIIADMVHTHASTLELVHKIKKEKLLLITDAMRAGCMKCGTYDLGGRVVEVSDGKAVLDDGTLAGSVLKMNEALHNMTTHTSMTLVEAVNAVTKVPAQKLGVNKGELKVGFDAFPDIELNGVIEDVANVGEKKRGSDIKVFQVLVKLNEVNENTKPGMTTSNRILTHKEEDVLTIPLEAVFSKDSISFAYVKAGYSIHKKQIDLGASNNNVVIVKNGLKENDEVYLNEPEGLEEKSITLLKK